MIRRLGRYTGMAYPPAIYLPYMLFWGIGLTALLAIASGDAARWRPDIGLGITAVTLVADMLLLRALDDIRDHDYDRRHNPGRPLPSGVVRERDLITLIVIGGATVLLLNAARGMALLVLGVQLGYAIGIITLDRLTGWPPGDKLMLHLVVNLPIQPMLSLYVYVGFLRAVHQQPTLAGLMAVAAATFGGLCLEFGRKATRCPKAGERTYATMLGPWGTTATALAFAAAAAAVALGILRPWQSNAPGYIWGWLVLVPPALPAIAAIRFSAGTVRWPAVPTIAYVPVMYASFLAVGWLTKGVSL
jgi:4-hydroxybenzoate polyprenyltransferase